MIAPVVLITHTNPQPRDSRGTLDPALTYEHSFPCLQIANVVRALILAVSDRLIVFSNQNLHFSVSFTPVPIPGSCA